MIEPIITPFTKNLCKKGYTTIMGSVETIITEYLMTPASCCISAAVLASVLLMVAPSPPLIWVMIISSRKCQE